jgi:hypothetical protein
LLALGNRKIFIYFYTQIKRRARIVSHKKLKDFYETKGREDSRVALERWYHTVLKAEWIVQQSEKVLL